MPKGRWNHDDQRHLCGAYRDNRTVPYEGILVDEMTDEQKGVVIAICQEYLLYLPEKARQLRLEQIRAGSARPDWCWIGGYGDADPFYYRIQSPVVIIEFDHHSGVFLTNKRTGQVPYPHIAEDAKQGRLWHGHCGLFSKMRSKIFAEERRSKTW